MTEIPSPTPTPKPAPPVVRKVARGILFAIGLFLLGLPPAMMVMLGNYALLDDTRALFGAGVTVADDPNAPVVVNVSCRRGPRSLRSADRNIDMANWDCDLGLGPNWGKPPADDPFAGRSHDEGMAEWNRRLARQGQALLVRSKLGSINRKTVLDRNGVIPALHVLSPGDAKTGEKPRYGVVWGLGELLLRWLAWLLTFGLILAIGGVLVYVAWRTGRRPAG